MTTALQPHDLSKVSQEQAPEAFRAAAELTLYELLDEYVRLTEIIIEGTTRTGDEDDYPSFKLNDAAKLADKRRDVINAGTRARFGISFSDYNAVSFD